MVGLPAPDGGCPFVGAFLLAEKLTHRLKVGPAQNTKKPRISLRTLEVAPASQKPLLRRKIDTLLKHIKLAEYARRKGR